MTSQEPLPDLQLLHSRAWSRPHKFCLAVTIHLFLLPRLPTELNTLILTSRSAADRPRQRTRTSAETKVGKGAAVNMPIKRCVSYLFVLLSITSLGEGQSAGQA